MLKKIEEVIISEKPDVVLVFGDTNSHWPERLRQAKLHIYVAHVEAGLRSYDKSMPEEINECSWTIALTCYSAYKDSCGEPEDRGNQRNVYLTGDVMVDAQRIAKSRREKSRILADLGIKPKITVWRRSIERRIPTTRISSGRL